MQVEISEKQLAAVMEQAGEAGIRLEIQQGLPIWEFSPSPLHVLEVTRIDRSVRRGSDDAGSCGCLSYQDIAIRFPDGSIRRPDLSIYCSAPAPTQEATSLIPAAVIEVVSPGSEVKDLELGPSFYLLHGVLDVLVFEPRTGVVSHFRRGDRRQYSSPTDISLECGCTVTV